MLEKCEQATQGYIPKSTTSSSSPNGTSNDRDESDPFTKDIQAFIQMLEKENRPLLTNNAELDGLVSVFWMCEFPFIKLIDMNVSLKHSLPSAFKLG